MVQLSYQMKKLIPITDEEKAVRKSWGNYWGYFGRKERQNGYVKLLVGLMGSTVIHCDETEKPIEFVDAERAADNKVIVYYVKAVTREEILKKNLKRVIK